MTSLLDQLEPGIRGYAGHNDTLAALSIAVSLRRIADGMALLYPAVGVLETMMRDGVEVRVLELQGGSPVGEEHPMEVISKVLSHPAVAGLLDAALLELRGQDGEVT